MVFRSYFLQFSQTPPQNKIDSLRKTIIAITNQQGMLPAQKSTGFICVYKPIELPLSATGSGVTS